MRLPPEGCLAARLRPAAALCMTALVLLSSGNLAFGQDQVNPTALKRMTLEELGRIEVTSVAKAPEALSHTAAAMFVLTSEDIARSGVTSIPDALRLVPGVEVARIDTARNWVVGIRGFGDQFSKSVLVLIDGRSAYTPLWAGVHWPIQDTLIEDIERIEVIRGPGGTIWGANAQNGVINIITKPARDTHGVYASGLVGNVDRALAEFRVGGGRGELNYRAYVKGSNRTPQHHVDGREYDTWAMGQAGFRVDWERARDQFTLTGDAYRAELGESVRVHTFAPPASFLGDDPVDLHGVNLLMGWRRTNPQGSSWALRTFVDHTYRLGTDFGERRTTLDMDAVHQRTVSDRHAITAGLGVRTSPSEITETYSFSRFTPKKHTLSLFSAYVQDAVTIVPNRLTLTGGVKFEHNTFSGLDVQPSGRVLWTPNERQSVWASVTRAVRTPSRVDEDISVSLLLQTAPLIFAVIEGNPDLAPESLVGVEAGYRNLLAPQLYLDIALFRNRYDDLVDLGTPTARPDATDGVSYTALVLPWINGNEATTQGIEVSPDWQPSDRLRVRGAYSYVHIDLTAKPTNVRPVTLAALEGSTPRHQISIQSQITLGRGVQVDPIYRYVSRRDSQSVPAYHTADLHLGIPLGRAFRLAIVGQNLLQPHHVEWARDPGPSVAIKRAAYARLTWRR